MKELITVRPPYRGSAQIRPANRDRPSCITWFGRPLRRSTGRCCRPVIDAAAGRAPSHEAETDCRRRCRRRRRRRRGSHGSESLLVAGGGAVVGAMRSNHPGDPRSRQSDPTRSVLKGSLFRMAGEAAGSTACPLIRPRPRRHDQRRATAATTAPSRIRAPIPAPSPRPGSPRRSDRRRTRRRRRSTRRTRPRLCEPFIGRVHRQSVTEPVEDRSSTQPVVARHVGDRPKIQWSLSLLWPTGWGG